MNAMIDIKSYIKRNNWIWAAFGSLLFWLIMGLYSGKLNAESFISNAYAASYLTLLAFGQMLVITSGRGAIDLSIPGVLTLTAFVSMRIINGVNSNIPAALCVVFALSVLIGILNSLLVIYMRIPAIIATMAMNYILTTAALLINRKFSIFAIAPVLQAVTRNRLFGIPYMLYFTLLLAVLLYLLLNKSPYGKSLCAIGQNYTAAKLAGIKVVRVEMLTYIFSSVFAGVSGMLISARVGGALLGMGDAYTMESVASVVVGGTLISGGKASIPGTLVGCFFLGIIVTAMQLLGMSVGAQRIAKGLIIIFVVFIGTFQNLEEE